MYMRIRRPLHKSDPFRQLHYSVFNEEVANMLSILPKRHYTLLIAEIQYGFRIMGSMYDNVPFKYPRTEKMVKDFAELTLAPVVANCDVSQHGSIFICNNCIEVTL